MTFLKWLIIAYSMPSIMILLGFFISIRNPGLTISEEEIQDMKDDSRKQWWVAFYIILWPLLLIDMIRLTRKDDEDG